jgi:4-amino-4-deoxy-L-arabinose transferase-like glycosyltransferase
MSFLKYISKEKKFRLLIIAVVLIAAFLRLYRISDYMTFLGDEGRDALVAYNILHGKLTLLGPTASVGGFFLGPVYYYLISPFLLLFNYNPVGPAVMVAIFGIATVWLVYKIGSEFFNPRVGMFAAILYAVSPLVIAHSRSSWNPNIMPFFSLITLYFLFRGLKKDSFWLILLSGVFLGITMQLHYLATFLGVIIFVYIFLYQILLKNNKLVLHFGESVKIYFLLSLGFLIGFSPFLIFEVRHNFPNVRSIFNFIFFSRDTGLNPHFFETVINVLFRLFARLVANFPPPEQVSLNHINIAIWYYLSFTLCIFSFLIFLYTGFVLIQKRQENFPALVLVFLWLVLGVLLFGFYKKPIYDYYFGFMFPVPFFLSANLINFFFSKGTFFKFFGSLLFAMLIGINLSGIPFRYPPNKQLEQAKTISRFILEKAEGKPFNFALITGGNSDHAYRYFFTLWGNPPVVIQNFEVDPARKTVTNQLFVVCESLPCHPLGNPLWEIAGFGRAEISGSWDVSVVKVYKLVHYGKNKV